MMATYETKSMSVNHEVKGNLARVLATEDLVVEHKNVSTASFNVDTRVLILPMWEKASSVVYDMLVGHEVGHALYTPNEDLPNHIPHQFVNVVEDARIEKLMKRRYAGLNKCFYGGYQELHDEDFFQIKDEDISTFNLADRVNLFFKVGNYLNISFTEKETEIVKMIASCETFADVIIAAEELYKYCKGEEQEQTKVGSMDNHESNAGGSDPGESADQSLQEDSPEESGEGGQASSEGQSDQQSDQPSKTGSNQGGESYDPEVRTADNLEEAIKDLVSNSSFGENVYVELPKVNLDTVIASNSEVHAEIDRWWKLTEEKMPDENLFGEVDKEFVQFKRSAQKEVSYLVKEFECKKAADSYARATTARTGVLDCTKLHSYRYNEDIFKKVTTLADGKNHGLVFVLDWSGSMGNVLLDTVKQLLNLCWFCKKVQIPFEVYAFTYEWNPLMFDEEMESIPEKFPRKFGQIDIHRMFHMLNFLSSRTNSKQFDQQAKNIFRLAYQQSCYTRYHCPPGLDLSGTPLNESIIALHGIIPQFKNSNKLQKVNVVILTDGEGGGLTYTTENDYAPHGIGSNRVSSHCALRDRKTGNVYRKFDETYNGSLTAILLENLKDNFPEVNLIGFRIIGGSEFNRFYRYLYGQDRYYSTDVPESVAKVWRKEKSVEMKPMGYNALYVLASSGLSADTSFEVSDNASTAEIRKAFKQVLKKKSTNKKLLSSFASLVS